MSKPYKRNESQKSTGTSQKRYSRYTSVTEFNPDYSYVISDLKRIGIMAGGFFVVLIVLSFFL